MKGVQQIQRQESSMTKEDEKKKGSVKPTSGKVPLKSFGEVVHAKDKVSSPRSPLKASEEKGIEEETPRTVFKRKRTPGTEKASGDIELNKSLKKHKVLYNDGEEEVLNLKRERWELIEDNSVSDGNDDAEHSSHDTSSEVVLLIVWFPLTRQKRKKGNTDSEASKSKRRKVNNTPKSRQKGSATKSWGKPKDQGKASGSQTKGKSGKACSGKTKGESVKVPGSKIKGDSPKTPSHPKQDSHKTAKSKGPAKGKPPDSVKSRQTEAKSGKKRRSEEHAEEKLPTPPVPPTTRTSFDEEQQQVVRDRLRGKGRNEGTALVRDFERWGRSVIGVRLIVDAMSE
ncbi:Tudor/PWWP/MBT superfamily protein [Striga hermonthica]|uniref:Tudor/PWWP/MBT superfamily protein n=1 Tax=Striga hermonthica TaxID=68872 RepID=A0A9N7NP05_STRHE|nr:Tudor/PWWP/MBT superfamily protein [Striga hermonthica]